MATNSKLNSKKANTQNGRRPIDVDPRIESRSRWLWVAFILFFFGLQALLWTSALSMVRKHPIRPVETQTADHHDLANSTSEPTGMEEQN